MFTVLAMMASGEERRGEESGAGRRSGAERSEEGACSRWSEPSRARGMQWAMGTSNTLRFPGFSGGRGLFVAAPLIRRFWNVCALAKKRLTRAGNNDPTIKSVPIFS